MNASMLTKYPEVQLLGHGYMQPVEFRNEVFIDGKAHGPECDKTMYGSLAAANVLERECAAFDTEHPLAREVWESLQQHRREEWLSLAPLPFIVEPADSLLRRVEPDPWQEFADRVYRRELERWSAVNPMVLVGL